ncbi:MAG TPA: fibrobacter succinogenes major paralogous domain-containing protein [Prolixibacteraceae bacterium]|nr:fibrobacter succinogenes major paralogous domain-containing protein [Prolixibacteraceae bacterium]
MKIPLIVLFLFALQFWGCEEDDPLVRDNPYNGKSTAVFNPDVKYGKVTDADGNSYRTVVIGGQTWMAENLRTTHFRNGDPIPEITDTTEWATTTAGAYCTYNNTGSVDTIATYGRLYNWYAVADSCKLAPEGWRVPTIIDWDTLIEYLGGDTLAGNKLKEVGIFHWEDPYQSDNGSGFTALPGGRRYLSKPTNDMGFYATFWSSSEYDPDRAGFLYLYDFDSFVWRGINFKNNGYSIRCIKE